MSDTDKDKIISYVKSYNDRVLDLIYSNKPVSDRDFAEIAIFKNDLFNFLVSIAQREDFSEIALAGRKFTIDNWTKEERKILDNWTKENLSTLEKYEQFLESETN